MKYKISYEWDFEGNTLPQQGDIRLNIRLDKNYEFKGCA